MDLIEKYAVAPAVIFMAWLGSFEWRLRNKVSKDLFNQSNEDLNRRLGRGVERFDSIDKELKAQSGILTKVHTIVERMEKNNG